MKNALWLFGAELNVKVDEKETAGRYDLVEGIFPAGGEIPLHMHSKYSETIYVLEGEQTVFMPANTKVLKAGDQVFIPAGTPHALLNTGNEPCKALAITSPSGFAKLVQITGLPGKADGTQGDLPNDIGLFMKVSEEIGDVLLGPPGTRP